jgi:hypothetical protein
MTDRKVQITFFIDEDIRDTLKERSKLYEMSMSQYARYLLKEKVKEFSKKDKLT